MSLVFGGRTADIEELLVQSIRAEHASVLAQLGELYCSYFGQVGLDQNNRAVQILDPYLDVTSVNCACRSKWCRLFEKHSKLDEIDRIPFVANYLEEEDLTTTSAVVRRRNDEAPELALIPQNAFRPYKQRASLNDRFPLEMNEKLLLDTNSSDEKNQFADACRRVVTAQKLGATWRPPCIPLLQKREVALMRNLLSQDVKPEIGNRIKVYWPGDHEFYPGTVADIRTRTTFHHVVYDDGDQEWLPLGERLFQVVEDCTMRKKAPTSGTVSESFVPQCPDEKQSPRIKRSRSLMDKVSSDMVHRKVRRCSYDEYDVNGEAEKRVDNQAKLPVETARTHKDRSLSKPSREQHETNKTDQAKHNSSVKSDENINELISRLELLIDCTPRADSIAKVESLVDTLMNTACESLVELRRRLKLSAKLRKTLPKLENLATQLVDKTMISTRLFLINHWKEALTAKNTEAMEEDSNNFLMILPKPLDSTIVEKHGLTKLVHDSKVLFAANGLVIPKALGKLAETLAFSS